MSIDSLAISRKNASHELAQLAEEHMKHDLQQSDRDALNDASKRFGSYTAIGSLVGLGLGAILAVRVRRARTEYFKAFRAIEKPTHVKFADGREGKLSLIFIQSGGSMLMLEQRRCRISVICYGRHQSVTSRHMCSSLQGVFSSVESWDYWLDHGLRRGR